MTPKERTEFRFTLNEEEQEFLSFNDEQTAKLKEKAKNGKEPEEKFCEFCGKLLNGENGSPSGVSNRRKYCSEQCQKIASRRRTSARLGIPSRSVSKLNPLYFD